MTQSKIIALLGCSALVVTTVYNYRQCQQNTRDILKLRREIISLEREVISLERENKSTQVYMRNICNLIYRHVPGSTSDGPIIDDP